VNKYQALLNQVKAFVGEPTDFLAGRPFTMMFDVVAAAHLFPEYFWIGNAWSHFMANGWGEEAGTIPLTGDFGGIFGSISNTDQRALARGYKLSAQLGAARNDLDILHIGESIARSRYSKSGVNYPNGHAFEHPWMGQTVPDTTQTYSWLKSPRYNIGGTLNTGTHQIDGGNWFVMEVGPLARQVVNGTYWGGILNLLYPIAPAWGQAGPDCATGADPLGAALRTVYAGLPPATGGPNLSGVAYNGDSVLDRIAARATETRILVDEAQKILNDLNGTIGGDGYGPSGCTDRFGENVPIKSQTYRGYGMSEASRGALSHWIALQNGKTTLYQCVVPTTWNASPRDANGNPGPAEKSLMSDGGLWIADPNQPIEVIRTTHSYDFCIACAVHLITPKGDVVKVDVPALPG
jgi:Ni,Fe-hydrogenase I large subunit